METKRIRRKDLEQAEGISKAGKELEKRMIAENTSDYKDFVLENHRRGIGGVE